jgi:hypothetical protein
VKFSTKFNVRVPKDLRENMQWRARVHEKAAESDEFPEIIKQACAKDPLFFINGFGWTYDPRVEPFPRLPFILYPFQEEAIETLASHIGRRDLLVEKSRDMGASWLCVSAIFWAWLFRRDQSFLFVSRKEEYVDQPGNPKSLFWKFDFLLDNLPAWMRPRGYTKSQHSRSMHRENPETGSVADGESTNTDVARGDRRTAIILDEFAAVREGSKVLSATRDATKCRIFNSTPAGSNNAFYDVKMTEIDKLRLHWSLHPIKAAGLYNTDENGKLKVLDPMGYPDGYKPTLDGKLRSPWYDEECARATTLQEIAQELDIDYIGSGHQFFNQELVQQKIREHCRKPMIIGFVEYDQQTGEFIEFREDPEGNVKLWFLLDGQGNPPLDHKYTLGVDVAAGTGASNSTACGWDNTFLEKKVEFVNPFIRPEQLAKQVNAIATWLGNAKVIWESGGPGRQFGDRLTSLGYSNIYYRQREEAISRKTTDIPGVAQTKDSKLAIMSGYRTAIEKGNAINRSKIALEEALEYTYDPQGGVIHARAMSKDDPSGAKANHGDRAMGDALAWKGIFDRFLRHKAKDKPKPRPKLPYGSLAWRNEQRKRRERQSSRELDRTW